jgi:hypothetical protein
MVLVFHDLGLLKVDLTSSGMLLQVPQRVFLGSFSHYSLKRATGIQVISLFSWRQISAFDVYFW